MGPDEGRGAELDQDGRLRRVLADTRVRFDEVEAPLLFVRGDQINAQTPYAVEGRVSVIVQVEHQGALSNPVAMDVAETAPGVFVEAGGAGQGAIVNEDRTRNSAANPAARGSVIEIYATGEGQTEPAGEEGKLAEAPYPVPRLAVAVNIGGLPADIEFAGSAPGFAGLLQINARIPAGVTPGSDVPVAVHIGGVSAQAGTTVAVQ
jgi:uncharacterized protein (TIGR03437 family)